MFTLTRRFIKSLRTVIRRSLGVPRGAGPSVQFQSGPEGMWIRAQHHLAAVEYQTAEPQSPGQFSFPLQTLDELQGGRQEPASILRVRDGVIGATWEDRGVTRYVEYAEPDPGAGPFPQPPQTLASNPASLRHALREAFATADSTSSRYALGCAEIRGSDGSLAATDGRQLLLQRGFAWGFQDHVLVPKVTVFDGPDLDTGTEVLVGRLERQVMFRFGPWSVWLPIDSERRFPRVDDVIPVAGRAATVWNLSPTDARFYIENAHHLPGGPAERRITVDLAECVSIRAQAADSPCGTEMRLTNSSRTGADLRVALDRRYLLRAANLGFEKIYLNSASSALLAEDGRRSMVWMPLSEEGLLGPSGNYLRLTSPPNSRVPKQPACQRKATCMSTPNEPTAHQTPQPSKRSRERSGTAAEGGLEFALQLRDRLRSDLNLVQELIRNLQVERKQGKVLRSTLASLRKLPQPA